MRGARPASPDGLCRTVVLCALVLMGCAPAVSRSEITPIPDWTRPLCLRAAVAVSSPWDAEVGAIFARLVQAAGEDVRDRDPAVVVVEGENLPAAGVCGGAGLPSTVLVSVRALRAASTWPEPIRRAIIATQLAHELAHVALHQERGPQVPRPVKEGEADALGVYYLERAGFDCREWVAGIGTWYRGGYASARDQRTIIETACALAKQGERPRLPAR